MGGGLSTCFGFDLFASSDFSCSREQIAGEIWKCLYRFTLLSLFSDCVYNGLTVFKGYILAFAPRVNKVINKMALRFLQ